MSGHIVNLSIFFNVSYDMMLSLIVWILIGLAFCAGFLVSETASRARELRNARMLSSHLIDAKLNQSKEIKK